MPIVETGAEADYTVMTSEGVIPIRLRMINSSNIKWIGWPRVMSAVPLMFVEFKDGSRYAYFDVTRQKAVAAAYAESSGKYLAERIKPHHEVMKLR